MKQEAGEGEKIEVRHTSRTASDGEGGRERQRPYRGLLDHPPLRLALLGGQTLGLVRLPVLPLTLARAVVDFSAATAHGVGLGFLRTDRTAPAALHHSNHSCRAGVVVGAAGDVRLMLDGWCFRVFLYAHSPTPTEPER